MITKQIAKRWKVPLRTARRWLEGADHKLQLVDGHWVKEYSVAVVDRMRKKHPA